MVHSGGAEPNGVGELGIYRAAADEVGQVLSRLQQRPRALAADQSEARAVLAKRVAAKEPNMVLASAYVPPDGAIAAYLLHRMFSLGDTTGTRWHSVFVNSGVEAIGTVAKYLRNRTNRRGNGQLCRILVLDPTGTTLHAFGHTVPGLRAVVDDGMTIVADVEEFCARAPGSWTSCIVVCDGLDDDETARVRGALADLKRRRNTVAYGVLRDESAMARIRSAPPDVDIVFLGEVCTQGQISCGTVSFTRRTFALWNNVSDSIAHISTFGGNGIALQLLCDRLTELRAPDHRELATVDRIRRNAMARRARLRMHANSWQTRNIDLGAINLTFDRADGVIYTSGDRHYTDLASGAGPAFRGHNEQSPEFIASAGTTGNEFELLEKKLAELTGLAVMLPAISGGSAVDNAIIAALCARPGRTTVVTLRRNYSGKGPMSLAVSRTSPFFRDLDHNPFRPYPVNVIEADIDDVDTFRQILRRDDIALVWMEAVLGFDCIEIPRLVLDAITLTRPTSGYLIGVDEVFTGFWRGSPEHFLASTGYGIQPDVVAISKGLSDALVPIGATMLSAPVFDDLAKSAPDLANWLRSHYRSDLAAGLAVAAVEEAVASRDSSAAVEAALESMLAKAAQSPVFVGYRRAGLFGKLLVAPPPRILGALAPLVVDYADAVVSRLIATRCAAIPLQLRFVPCTAGKHGAELIRALHGVGAFLQRLKRLSFYRMLVTSAVEFAGLEVATTLVALCERRHDTKVQGKAAIAAVAKVDD